MLWAHMPFVFSCLKKMTASQASSWETELTGILYWWTISSLWWSKRGYISTCTCKMPVYNNMHVTLTKYLEESHGMNRQWRPNRWRKFQLLHNTAGLSHYVRVSITECVSVMVHSWFLLIHNFSCTNFTDLWGPTQFKHLKQNKRILSRPPPCSVSWKDFCYYLALNEIGLTLLDMFFACFCCTANFIIWLYFE